MLQRKTGGNKSLSSGENHMKYSDDEGDGVGMHDDLDDLDGGTAITLYKISACSHSTFCACPALH